MYIFPKSIVSKVSGISSVVAMAIITTCSKYVLVDRKWKPQINVSFGGKCLIKYP